MMNIIVLHQQVMSPERWCVSGEIPTLNNFYET